MEIPDPGSVWFTGQLSLCLDIVLKNCEIIRCS